MQQLFGLDRYFVALVLVHLVEPAGQFVVVFGVGNAGFDFAVGLVAVDGVVQRGAVGGDHFLRHVRLAPFCWQGQLATVYTQFTVQKGEQTRLAGPVGADQSELLAIMNAKTGVFQ